MDRLTARHLFVRIAEGGSVAGAGRGLGISATGRLTALLPDWRLAPAGYKAVMVAGHATAFVAHLLAQGV